MKKTYTNLDGYRVSVSITPQQRNILEIESRRRGMALAAQVRRIIDEWLEERLPRDNPADSPRIRQIFDRDRQSREYAATARRRK